MHTIRLINNKSETEGSAATGKTMNEFLIISLTRFFSFQLVKCQFGAPNNSMIFETDDISTESIHICIAE